MERGVLRRGPCLRGSLRSAAGPLLALRAARPCGRAPCRRRARLAPGPSRPPAFACAAPLRGSLLLRRHSGTSSRAARSGPGLPFALYHELPGGELVEPHRPEGVELAGGDADLGAEPELAAVVEAGVEALMITALAVTSRSKRRALARSRVRIASVWSEPWRAMWSRAASRSGTTRTARIRSRNSRPKSSGRGRHRRHPGALQQGERGRVAAQLHALARPAPAPPAGSSAAAASRWTSRHSSALQALGALDLAVDRQRPPPAPRRRWRRGRGG